MAFFLEIAWYIVVSITVIYVIRSFYHYVQQSYTTPKTVNLHKIYEQKYHRMWEDYVPHVAEASVAAPVPSHDMRESLRQMVRDSDI
jgi:hypothetical protein